MKRVFYSDKDRAMSFVSIFDDMIRSTLVIACRR